MASAVPYASLHLATDRQPHQHPTSVFTGRMPFLPPNQQRQSTEGMLMFLVTECLTNNTFVICFIIDVECDRPLAY